LVVAVMMAWDENFLGNNFENEFFEKILIFYDVES
jgi:hypothetical protein